MDKATDTKTDTSLDTQKVLGVVIAIALLIASFAVGRFTAPTTVEVQEPGILIEEGTEAIDEVDEVVPETFEEVEPIVVPTPEK